MSETRSFVALGDSFTEGLADDLGPDGRHRGWADRVAEALSKAEGSLRYANLAVRGRLLDEVVTEQVPQAVALAPSLVSFHAGANDVLRPRCEVADLLRRYDDAVRRLARVAGEVLLFTVIERSGGTGRLANGIAARFRAFNDGVRFVAGRYGATLVDVGAEPALQDRRLWHEDRLHLNAEGHVRVAAAVLEALGLRDESLLGGQPGWWRQPLPRVLPSRRREVLADDLRWARRHFAPWVWRRLRGVSSGDGLEPKRPDLSDVG